MDDAEFRKMCKARMAELFQKEQDELNEQIRTFLKMGFALGELRCIYYAECSPHFQIQPQRPEHGTA